MDMTQRSCREFVEALASSAPTPGGGGAAALAGAVGTALGNMVASLTLGKKKYADVQEEILELKEKCDGLQKELLDQVEADEKGFLPLAKAYAIPKEDPRRAAVMEEAILSACAAPMRIMELCSEAMASMAVFAEKGSRLALSDAGCGAVLCKAAMQAAFLNIIVNTDLLSDREKAERLNRRAEEMLEKSTALADRIYEDIRGNYIR